MPYKFLGHGSAGGTLVLGDKTYQVGDLVPLSKEAVAAHVAAGLSFEGADEPAVMPSIPASEPDTRPRDDGGRIVDKK